MGGLLIHTVEILLIRDATNYINSGMAFIKALKKRKKKQSSMATPSSDTQTELPKCYCFCSHISS
eukprot:scaffold82298_cov45-Cyclotella_meneghiniana.AAC.16